jgi:hypothetical protein
MFGQSNGRKDEEEEVICQLHCVHTLMNRVRDFFQIKEWSLKGGITAAASRAPKRLEEKLGERKNTKDG